MAVNAAARADKSQERFYDALRDLFVGAKVEGQSGFISLTRIKSRYYTEGVSPKLQQDIDPAYYCMVRRRRGSESGPLFAQAAIEYRATADLLYARKCRRRRGCTAAQASPSPWFMNPAS